MENKILNKINIGISACQYGCKLRYNAKGWDILENLKREKSEFIWYPVCPEVMAGLGVPRSPISLSKMEIFARENNILFGSSPIMRDR